MLFHNSGGYQMILNPIMKKIKIHSGNRSLSIWRHIVRRRSQISFIFSFLQNLRNSFQNSRKEIKKRMRTFKMWRISWKVVWRWWPCCQRPFETPNLRKYKNWFTLFWNRIESSMKFFLPLTGKSITLWWLAWWTNGEISCQLRKKTNSFQFLLPVRFLNQKKRITTNR